MLKGAMHVHSTYSDGEFSLPELRHLFLAENCSFVCMTDHAESFDAASLQSYLRECELVSDDKLRFIAGLEYECERRLHILGYGATELVTSTDPEAVIRHIAKQGAVSVIAHPKDDLFPWIESFPTLPDAIEGWNSKYDGRYAPRPGTFALLQRLQQRKPDLRAAYGQDLHWKKQFHGLFVQLHCRTAEPAPILDALRKGNYHALKGELRLPSTGIFSQEMSVRFARTQGLSHRAWRALKQTKKILDSIGIKVPESLKAHMRRIF